MMDWSFFFMLVGIAYACTWPLKIVDKLEEQR